MRVLFAIHELALNSAVIALLQQVRRMAARNDAVTVIVPELEGPAAALLPQFQAAGAQVVRDADPEAQDIVVGCTIFSAPMLRGLIGKLPTACWIHEAKAGVTFIAGRNSDIQTLCQVELGSTIRTYGRLQPRHHPVRITGKLSCLTEYVLILFRRCHSKAAAMSPFPFLHPLVFDLILSRITPWLLQTAENDINAAEGAAVALLRAYDPATEQEALLAAEAICFHLGSLETLSKSVSPGLSIATVLRMRGNANTLNRSAHRSQAKLAALRKQRTMGPVDARSTADSKPALAQQAKRPIHSPAKPSPRHDRERWEAGRSRRPLAGGSRPVPLAVVTPTRVPRRKAA